MKTVFVKRMKSLEEHWGQTGKQRRVGGSDQLLEGIVH